MKYTSVSTEGASVQSLLKNNPTARRLIDLWRLSPARLGSRGFHGDRILRQLVKQLVRTLPVTSFIETGTNEGETCGFAAKTSRRLPIYSCEIHPPFFELSRKRLAEFPMVKIHQESSPDFLRELVAQQLFGDLPLFWLDAHWYVYWPLEDELRIITSNVGNAIILIDDFQIPNRPQFGYDVEQNEAAHVGG